jgi:hypothetical protein
MINKNIDICKNNRGTKNINQLQNNNITDIIYLKTPLCWKHWKEKC